MPQKTNPLTVCCGTGIVILAQDSGFAISSANYIYRFCRILDKEERTLKHFRHALYISQTALQEFQNSTEQSQGSEVTVGRRLLENVRLLFGS